MDRPTVKARIVVFLPCKLFMLETAPQGVAVGRLKPSRWPDDDLPLRPSHGPEARDYCRARRSPSTDPRISRGATSALGRTAEQSRSARLASTGWAGPWPDAARDVGV